MFKTTFLLIALWVGGDGADFHIFKELKFANKKECVVYVMEQHVNLDLHLSKVFKASTIFNNMYWCADAKIFRERLEKTIQKNSHTI